MAAYDAPDDSVQIRDFTIKQKLTQFRIDDDVFSAYRVVSLPLMQSLVRVSSNISRLLKEEKYEVIFELFDAILEPDSAKRFRERALSIGDDAISINEQVLPILHYLMEEFGLRPTRSSLASSSGLPEENSGTSSMVGSAHITSN